MSSMEELIAEIDKLKKENNKLNKSIKHTKFGLVWMDVPEGFDKESENKIPLLEESKEDELVSTSENEPNILIEGDNYHSLTCLNYTHKNAIDVIYIDPPYNTEKGDFKYKDKRVIDKYPGGKAVKKDDPIRHSKWLSFMNKRLLLARKLLKPEGVIFISIDDNEMTQLKMLCDQIFKGNFIACLPTIMNLKGNNDQFGFAGTHEYTLVYAKDITKAKLNGFDVDEEELMKDWMLDDIGSYKEGANLKSTGGNAPREKRPYLYFPVLINKEDMKPHLLKEEEYTQIYNKVDKTFNDEFMDKLRHQYDEKGFHFLLPLTNDVEMSWRWSIKKMRNETDDIIVKAGKGSSFSLVKKQRPKPGELPSKKPKSLFYKPEYSSGNGTSQQKKIFGKKVFNNPKPLELIKDLLHVGAHKDALVLDFFAGSGTTAHAVLDLNRFDQGNRRFILCTNNEDNICRDVTYERLRILHSPNDFNVDIAPLPTNLKYYRTKFSGNNISAITDDDKVEIAHNAGELIAISENILYETLKNEYSQFFTNKSEEKHLAIYFNEDYDDLDSFKELLKNNITGYRKKVLVYIFSWGNEDHSSMFYDLDLNISVKPIPQPILEIYKKIYKA